MKVDLHVHIKKLSRCAKMDIISLVPHLLAHKIYGVAPLDHHYFTSDEDIKEIKAISDKITVFKATELSIRGPKGNREDVILISSIAPTFKLRKAKGPELTDFINKTDALTILAHPYRRRDFVDFNWDWFIPDAVEIWSTHIEEKNRDKIRALANHHGMQTVVTSDAHRSKHLGKYYIEVPDGVQTCEELKWIIKTNRYTLPI